MRIRAILVCSVTALPLSPAVAIADYETAVELLLCGDNSSCAETVAIEDCVVSWVPVGQGANARHSYDFTTVIWSTRRYVPYQRDGVPALRLVAECTSTCEISWDGYELTKFIHELPAGETEAGPVIEAVIKQCPGSSDDG